MNDLLRNPPRALLGRVMASTRTGMPTLPVPNRDRVHAFTSQEVLDRWGEDASGLRAVERGDNVITMFDVIGEDYWSGGGITAKTVSKQLRAIGGPVEVQINSPGGDVFEGFAVYNVLREHPYDVNIKVIGMAASAASVIAMAGDTVQIGAAAFVMIHNCWCIGIGNRHEFRELADFLEPFDQALAAVYESRTGQKLSDITKWMDAETYMSGQTAVERGFADELLPSDQIEEDAKAKADTKRVNEVRSMEIALQASGLSRSQARAKIQALKGAREHAVLPLPEQAREHAATAEMLRSILSNAQLAV